MATDSSDDESHRIDVDQLPFSPVSPVVAFAASVLTGTAASIHPIGAAIVGILAGGVAELALRRFGWIEGESTEAAEDDDAEPELDDLGVDLSMTYAISDGATAIELDAPATLPTDVLTAELAVVVEELPTGDDGDRLNGEQMIVHTERYEAPGRDDVQITITAPEGVAERIIEEAIRSVDDRLAEHTRTPKAEPTR